MTAPAADARTSVAAPRHGHAALLCTMGACRPAARQFRYTLPALLRCPCAAASQRGHNFAWSWLTGTTCAGHLSTWRARQRRWEPAETAALTRAVTPHRRVHASQKSMAPGDDGRPAPDSFVLSMGVTACQMCCDAHPLAVSVKWRRRHQWSHYPLDKSPPHSIQHRTLVLLICGEGADGQ